MLFQRLGVRVASRARLLQSRHAARPGIFPSGTRGFHEELARIPEKEIPDSPSFYTTRAAYNDQLIELEKAISFSEVYLRQNSLYPLPDFARASLPPLQPVWKSASEMEGELKTKLTSTRHRRVVKLLNKLLDFQRIADAGGEAEFSESLGDILAAFESSNKDAMLNKGKRKPVVLDEYGRSYTVGKRKTSAARVWMIPAQHNSTLESLLPGIACATEVIVNNMPIHQYFPLPVDRERITRPLRVAGVLGKYHIFTIVRGGGTSGQSSAIAHGISKAIKAHEPELATMFKRGKLDWRDPRMVERKKTGLAKARKRYTWVKR